MKRHLKRAEVRPSTNVYSAKHLAQQALIFFAYNWKFIDKKVDVGRCLTRENFMKVLETFSQKTNHQIHQAFGSRWRDGLLRKHFADEPTRRELKMAADPADLVKLDRGNDTTVSVHLYGEFCVIRLLQTFDFFW